MSQLLSKLAVSFVAITIFSQAALADAQPRKKRKGFFESIFGSSFSNSGTKKRRPANRARSAWWEQNNDRDIRVIYGDDLDSRSRKQNKSTNKKTAAKKKIIPTTIGDGDPEGIPGLGMGNVTYAGPLLQPLSDVSLVKLPAYGLMEISIRQELANKNNGLRAIKIERDAIIAHYKQNSFKPIWLQNGVPSERAKLLLASFAKASEDGMEPLNYLPVGLQGFDDQLAITSTDQSVLANFDIALTAAALKYARHISGGQFVPNSLSLYNDIKPETVEVGQALRVLAWSPFPVEYLKGLQPSHPQYALMKAALAKQLASAETVDAAPIASGPRVKPGQKDARMIAVRQRAIVLGLLPANGMVADETVLDDELAAALKTLQAANAIKLTGNLDPLTIKALNAKRGKSDRERLIVNMERLRWLPKNLGNRHVFVNQPAFEVTVLDGIDKIWRSNVIIGRELTQTNAFHDQMETVVFNPSWGVPQSILVNEYLPKLRRDPSYLDKQGFKVVNKEGKVVSSRSVNWSNVGTTPAYGVQQPPGGSNALGELKFLFPNQHSIYMHDTPNRNLFEKSTRAFSHGCVRVQNPREFAAVLLGLDPAEIDAATDSGESVTRKLDSPVPVHITYFTAWAEADGSMKFYSDIYGRDENMLKALAEQTRIRNGLFAEKIVQN